MLSRWIVIVIGSVLVEGCVGWCVVVVVGCIVFILIGIWLLCD